MTFRGHGRAAAMEHKRGLILYHRNFQVRSSNHNPLDLIERDLIGAPIIQAGRAGTLVIGHLLRNFQFPPVAEIFRNSGRTKGMIADLSPNADVGGAATNHAVSIWLGHRFVGELPGPAVHRPKEQRLALGQLCRLEVGVERVLRTSQPKFHHTPAWSMDQRLCSAMYRCPHHAV